MAAESVKPGLVNRMMRALSLDTHLYEEVERDKTATGQAAFVVVLASVIAGVGLGTAGGPLGILLSILLNLTGWAIWAWMNYTIGAKLVAEKTTQADWGELARAMGFAYTPRIFLIFALIPVPALRGIITIAITIWVWIGMVKAVKSALDYQSTLRAVGVTLIGALVNGILMSIIAVVLVQAT